MAMTNPYQVYKNQSIMLAAPEELTLMLYNGCAKFIGQAEISITNHDISQANQFIQRAQAILEELKATLNMSYRVSEGLMELYQFMIRRLIDANIAKDVNVLKEVLDLVIELRDTWAEAMRLTSQRPAISSRG